MENELLNAIREQHEAEKKLEACKRRVYELSGVYAESEQRKTGKRLKGKDFAKACMSL